MAAAPRLATFMNWLALDGLVEPGQGWLGAIRDAGYDGLQLIEPRDPALAEAAHGIGLRVCGSGRVNHTGDADRLARDAAAGGLECLTVHLGWGIEDDDQAFRLIEAVLEASARHRVPLFVETHRATLFQDLWRSVQFVHRFPELRFNGDFSHWYTGLELAYGDFAGKLDFAAPVLDRVDFMHGRIGDPGAIQVDLGSFEEALEQPFVEHFREIWTRVFRSHLARHGHGRAFPFAPELLSSRIFYARTLDGCEYSDRWTQSLLLIRLAQLSLADAVA
jgi:sugar phosphate isomerase/epimerase